MMAVLVLVAVGIAGCAEPDDPGGGVASIGSATPSAPAPTDGGAAGEDGGLKHAQCMREQGMSWFKDPEPGQRGLRIVVPQGQDPAKVDAAMEACKKFLPNGGQPRKLDPADVERARQMAKCMRENGVPNFPDPGPNGEGRINKGMLGVGPEDPAFQAAEKACARFRPSNAPRRSGSGS
ncbi:hypothetical protein [Jidongwangia harbinensis]|uniref:hypothetical protein n=1 Tax=Jidongwangia harbinensis TaxID=2878561 RepID=UPI001CD94EFF|nr:hypothetical protein [Jidongwangia harbinensis]MCA2216788.1 hypothetical protein [Jidongwangia harbinensis]